MRPVTRSRAKAPTFKVFNLRKVPDDLFYRIKMAAAAEKQTSRDWLLALAVARCAELEQQGKLPKDT